MQSDSELIAQIRDGRTEVYRGLVERYERLARGAAFRILHDSNAVDEVVQEAFVAAFVSLASLRTPSCFGAWLLGIVRRRAARAVRTRSRSPAVLGETAVAGRNGSLSPDAEELLELVERLPEHERIVIALRHFEDYSMDEIAQATGRPVGTVTKQLSRAHARLRQWLGEEDPT